MIDEDANDAVSSPEDYAVYGALGGVATLLGGVVIVGRRTARREDIELPKL